MEFTKEELDELQAFSRLISEAKLEATLGKTLDNAKLLAAFVRHMQKLDVYLKEKSKPLRVEPVVEPVKKK